MFQSSPGERDWRLVLVGLGIVNVDEWVQSAKMWPKRGFVANCGMRLDDAPPISDENQTACDSDGQ